MIIRNPLTGPVVVGEKVAITLQVCCGPSALGQLLLCENGTPPCMKISLIVMTVPCFFVARLYSSSPWFLLLPTATLPKSNGAGRTCRNAFTRGCGVAVGVAVGAIVGVGVGPVVGVAVGVRVGAPVGVGVGVGAPVGVLVAVRVAVAVGEPLEVAVAVGVLDGVGLPLDVGVAVGVGDGANHRQTTPSSPEPGIWVALPLLRLQDH